MTEVTAVWDNEVLVVVGPINAADLAVIPVHALALAGPLVPTAGSWSREGGVARFRPLFPPVPGTIQAVVAVPAVRGGQWRELTRAAVPDVEPVPSTRIERIDPGVATVPENLLRFSVSFSAPIQEGSAAGHLHLVGPDGTELIGTLLAMPPELWDRPRRRLTVLLEPGRIKRGLLPNVAAGPPLIVGSAVTLVVDRHLRDARGAPLLAGAERSYQVGEPIRSRVDPRLWDIQWPGPEGGPLVVRFGRALDRALVSRCLTVRDGEGRPVPGLATLDPDASTWTFTPFDERVGGCGLHVHPDLEDLAGNSVRRVFDRDLSLPTADDAPTSGIVLHPGSHSAEIPGPLRAD